MKKSLKRWSKASLVSLRAMLVLTVLLGVVYPLVMTAIGQVAFPGRSNGSLVTDQSGTVVGSSLVGQSFSDKDGNPLPQYFQPRLSVHDYDATQSGGSNLGPDNPELVARIAASRAAIAAFNGVAESAVPADAVTASESGLDPDISPQYAAIQINRVASARGLTPDQVAGVVRQNTLGRTLGFIGEPRVNVVTLNLALDQLPG